MDHFKGIYCLCESTKGKELRALENYEEMIMDEASIEGVELSDIRWWQIKS